MSRRPVIAALGALLLALPVAAQAQSSTQTPAKESGNPINDQGSNYHYRSNITTIAPNVPGLSLEVLEFADRLVLRNHTGRPSRFTATRANSMRECWPTGRWRSTRTRPPTT